jgi:aminoglycoside phosphotransferase family enzyme
MNLARIDPEERRGVSATVPRGAESRSRTGFEATLAFLSRPENYPDATRTVERIETHLSWVFLTERHAYKLKKAIHDEFVDLRRVEARRARCEEEIRLNRRLSADVYLDTIAIRRDSGGRLALSGTGEPIDWLVRMRRLPAARMLDAIITSGAFEGSMLVPVINLLCRLYRDAVVPLSGRVYRARLDEIVVGNLRDLSRPEFGLPKSIVDRLCSEQRRYLGRGSIFDARAHSLRIVEGHGDLRPEHICIETPPSIIDALDFSATLRTLDAADELGFLALECERLGAPDARNQIFREYARQTGDEPPDPLIHFYQSLRAAVRARLAIRHLRDPDVRDRERWPAVARRYLELAGSHLGHCV